MKNDVRSKMIEKLHIAELSDMQKETEDKILRGHNDVVVLSPTGSGKTIAYLLPLVQMLRADSNAVQLVVVVPGRELALQSEQVLRAAGCNLRSQACYGGRTAMEEHQQMKRVRPHVIFGTPGRLNDHIDKGNIDVHLIKYIVIDEFDKCLEMGFHDEMSRLVTRLTSVERRFLLSATDAEVIPRFVDMGRTDRLDYLADGPQQALADRVELFRVDCPQKDKLESLARLLMSLGDTQSIVFLSYRDAVERVSDYLRSLGFVASTFHGGLEQRQREDALYRFANGSACVMVSTDLASRGLDIPHVDNIVHYHLPQSEETLVHRVGRTARWEASGRVFFLVGPEESVEGISAPMVPWVASEHASAGVPSPRMATLYIGKGRKDKVSRGDIVGFLCKKGGLHADEIGRIDVKERYAYAAVSRQKLRDVLKMTAGEKIKGLRTIVEPVH
ncbi:MAG: DEAD/DEAH box helicase [Prevotella sp.]|nr:DEAD/DEAH box helicase [Prevotella sp.]